MKAVVVKKFGAPKDIEISEISTPQIVAGAELVDVEYSGINFSDLHKIAGTYLKKNELPFIPGTEIFGRDSSGRRVLGFVDEGGHAQHAAVSAEFMVPVPDFVTGEEALALGLQGFTAWHLLRKCVRSVRGQSIVIHGAAGGVGSVAVQLAKAWGASRVIAVGSTPDKRNLAMSIGADTVVDSGTENMTAALLDANAGRPVDIVLEMVGGQTLNHGLAALGAHGRMVVYGTASNEPSTPVHLESLIGGSRSVVGFWAEDLVRTNPRALAETAAGLFGMVKNNQLKPVIGGAYPLDDAAKAFNLVAERSTVGKVVLNMAES
ncbi:MULTISPECIES: zinc-binding dehydrogenase [unclassified Nocardia]|uniref:quinone oxidoreductase family protein n=1 Tax=unclassified Nocardia TaxID=2637762 RepID=UPI001CE48B01|nr:MULTISPECIES: zinc-binding dehydrogenase [unclassified Nocardia]